MSDRARIERALRAAHAAGDVAAATRLAQELRSRDTAPPEPAQQPSETPRMAAGQSEGDIPVIIGTSETGAPIIEMPPPEEGFVPRADGTFQAKDATAGQQIRLAAGYFLNSSPEARKDMIQSILGDAATFETDSQGNVIVNYGGERGYINKPGMDSQDAIDLVSDMVKFAPAARFASFIGGPAMAVFGRGVSSLRAALAGGAAAGATQATSEYASGALGSEQGVDPLSVAGASVGAAGGELAGGLLSRLAARFAPRSGGLAGESADVLGRMDNLGINPTASPGKQVSQVRSAAEGMSSPERGLGLIDVAAGVRSEREAARSSARTMFDYARAQRASIPAEEVAGLSARINETLSSFDLGADGMSAVNRQVEALSQLADPSIPFPRKIQALEAWRARVRAMSPRDGSPAQAAASRAVREYDAWLDDVFNRDMVRGSPEAVDAWRDARSAWGSYKDRFDTNRVIRDLAKKDTTQEQMSQWLFNSSAVGAKKEAGQVVRGLNDILGKDSQQMAGLRAEVVLDIAAPLFDDTPNIQGFIRNYDRWFDRNPTLRRELFPGETGRDFNDLYRFSKSIAARPGASVSDLSPTDIGGRAINFLNRIYVGHGLARGAARIQSGNALANFIRQQTSGQSNRINMLRDYMGIEPTRTILPAPTATGASFMQYQQERRREESQ